jgi:hypothetical protein
MYNPDAFWFGSNPTSSGGAGVVLVVLVALVVLVVRGAEAGALVYGAGAGTNLSAGLRRHRLQAHTGTEALQAQGAPNLIALPTLTRMQQH